MSTVTKLRLVGARRYIDARIRTSSAVVLNEVVEIEDPSIAEQLLQVTFINRYNEPAPMFEEVEEVDDDESAPKKKLVRKTTTTRRPARKAVS